jgi:hypothetical protein
MNADHADTCYPEKPIIGIAVNRAIEARTKMPPRRPYGDITVTITLRYMKGVDGRGLGTLAVLG